MQSYSARKSVAAGYKRIHTTTDVVLLRDIFSVVGCCLMISMLAQVRIPMPNTDVPMTLQSLAVLFTGFALTPSRAVMAMLLYVTCGVAGLPVFAPGSFGLVGPTGGYILGFVAGAWLVSMIRGNRHAGTVRLFVAGFVGTFAVFTIGFIWLLPWCGGNVTIAFARGVIPFIPKAVVQLLFAVTLVVSIRGLRHAHLSRLRKG